MRETDTFFDQKSDLLKKYQIISISTSGKTSILYDPNSKKSYYWNILNEQILEVESSSSGFQPQFITADDKYVYDVRNNEVIFFDPQKNRDMVCKVASGDIELREKTMRWLSDNEFVICGFQNFQFWSFATVYKYNINTHKIEKIKKWHSFFSKKYYSPSQYTWINEIGFVCFDWLIVKSN